MFELLTTSVSVPVWFPVASTLLGGLVSVLAVLVFSAFPRKAKEQCKKAVSQSAQPVVHLSGVDRQELSHRAQINGGYTIEDVKTLLGVSAGDIARLTAQNKLRRFSDFRGVVWVTAKSLDTLVSEIESQADELMTRASEPALVSTARAPAAVSVTRTPSPKSIPLSGRLPIRQHYWYTLNGEKFTRLVDVLKAIPEYKGRLDTPEWAKLPPDIRARIHREKVQ